MVWQMGEKRMTIYKAEVFVELHYEHLCSGCRFLTCGMDTNTCRLVEKEWETETTDRPKWCPLKEVQVLR